MYYFLVFAPVMARTLIINNDLIPANWNHIISLDEILPTETYFSSNGQCR